MAQRPMNQKSSKFCSLDREFMLQALFAANQGNGLMIPDTRMKSALRAYFVNKGRRMAVLRKLRIDPLLIRF